MATVKSIKYIDDDPKNGIKYDYKKINKLYKSLGCPEDFYDPTSVPLDSVQYAVVLSDRASGKSTNWFLYGLCMYWLYGTVIQYVRQGEEDIAPKNSHSLFNVILDWKYIEKLTDGRYNSVYYKSRRWYLARYNANGELEELDDNNFMFMTSVVNQEKLKSSYNCPTGDLLIFDEFISRFYYPDEFIDFCNLTSTIFRFRQSPKCILLANTIEKHSIYFNDLMIYEDIQQMSIGDKRLITTPQGTKIYLEIFGLGRKRAEKKGIINKLFYGFDNPKLASITGVDWSMKNYQHIPIKTDDIEEEVLFKNIYIFFNNKYIRCDLVNRSDLGLCMFVHWANRTYPDSIILTVEDRNDNRFKFRFGNGTLNQLMHRIVQENRIYFASNDVGSFFTSYYKYATNYSNIT